MHPWSYQLIRRRIRCERSGTVKRDPSSGTAWFSWSLRPVAWSSW